MAHELTDTESHYAAKRDSDDALDYALEDAWNSEQEKADEDQIADDYLAGEHDRAGTTPDQRWEIAFDAGVIRKKRDADEAAAKAGGVADRPPAKVTKKAALDAAYNAHLGKVWDAMSGTPAKPAETKPEAAPPQQPAEAGGLSA